MEFATAEKHVGPRPTPVLMPLGKLKSPEGDQPEGGKSKLLFLTVLELLSVNHAMTEGAHQRQLHV